MNTEMLTKCAEANDQKLASDIKRIADKLQSGEIGAQESIDRFLFELACKEHVSRCTAIIQIFS